MKLSRTVKRESTSPRVARIAGKILQRLSGFHDGDIVLQHGIFERRICSTEELQATAATALTQAQNKPKKGTV